MRQKRQEAGFTVRRLAKKAGVSFALLTCIENAKRRAGRWTLERLGVALGLTGDTLDAFVLDGMVITKRERLLAFAEGYPARVLNALPLALSRMGVVPENVVACEAGQAIERTFPGSDLVVHLKDGTKVHVAFKFSRA